MQLNSKLIDLKKAMLARSSSLVAPPKRLDRTEKMIQLAAMATDANPTEQQKQTGNYRKGRFSFKGLTFVIENPSGSIRSGRDAEGNEWRVVMPVHYGYILKTVSEADGDQIDVFIGPDIGSKKVYAIDQVSFSDGKFDEHKIMVGFPDKNSAKAAYEASFSGSSPFNGIVEMSWDELKEWIATGDTSTSIVDQMMRDFNARIDLIKSYEEPDGSVYLYGACMVPNLVDKSPFRDYYDEEDVRNAARAYLVKSRMAGYKHKAIFKEDDVQLTQSFIAPSDMDIGGKVIPKSSWVVEFKLNHPEVIEMAKNGELAAFSIGGPARKWRLERSNGEKSKWFGPSGDGKII